ncbi:glycosyltransferase [Brachybacterium sp. DNPG3]
MKQTALDGRRQATRPGSLASRSLRNARLLATAALQHLADDPALLAIQVSRRLPFGPRIAVGRALEKAGSAFPAIGALGSVMAGREEAAEAAIVRANASGRPSRLAGEVAILLDRTDLVPESAPAPTRARAAWSRGAISTALAVLDEAGAQETRYARRLRSEARLLEPGFRLPVRRVAAPASPAPSGQGPADGEDLRVLHLLTNSLPHTQSGYSLRTHRILTALRDQGIQSVALTRTGYPVMVGIPTAADEDLVDGIRYVRTLPARLPQTMQERLEAEVERALELVEEFRPHVLHATTNYQNALVAQAVSDATGLPWVFEVRGLMEKTWVASHKTDASRAEAAASERHDRIAAKEGEQARDADAVVTLSGTMTDELAARGVDRAAIALVPNGVDESLFEDHVPAARARELTGLAALPPVPGTPGFGADAFLVGAVSALVDYEGYDVLLRAVARIVHGTGTGTGTGAADDGGAAADADVVAAPAALRERIAVVLAGDGVARPGLLALADELGIADRVHLPGRVPRTEARRWVEALDVVVVPRRDVEVTRTVTPQKPVEAMALGRPLIVSDLPALRETVVDDEGTVRARIVPPESVEALAGAIVDLAVLAAEHGPEMDDGPTEIDIGAGLALQRRWAPMMSRYRRTYRAAATRKKR